MMMVMMMMMMMMMMMRATTARTTIYHLSRIAYYFNYSPLLATTHCYLLPLNITYYYLPQQLQLPLRLQLKNDYGDDDYDHYDYYDYYNYNFCFK